MKKIVLLAALVFSAGLTFAGASSGCGLGTKMLKGKSGLIMNVIAVTTNGTSSNQTFGITSGTSGCSANDTVFQEKEAEVFIAANYDRIIEDAGKGQGEFVASLGSIVGCEEVAFAASVQSNYDKVFTGNDAQVVLRNTKALISQDSVLAASCQ